MDFLGTFYPDKDEQELLQTLPVDSLFVNLLDSSSNGFFLVAAAVYDLMHILPEKAEALFKLGIERDKVAMRVAIGAAIGLRFFMDSEMGEKEEAYVAFLRERGMPELPTPAELAGEYMAYSILNGNK